MKTLHLVQKGAVAGSPVLTKKGHTRLSDGFITELTLVTDTHDPRNPDAKVLAVKAGEKPPSPWVNTMREMIGLPKIEAANQPNFSEAVKAQLAANVTSDDDVTRDEVAKGWLISVEVPDDVDDDGDGAEDYEAIARVIRDAASDLNQLYWLNSDTARAAAAVAVCQVFKKNYADIYSGGDGMVAKAARLARIKKAGKRVSAETREKYLKVRTELDELLEVTGVAESLENESEVEKAARLNEDDPGVELAQGETADAVESQVEAFLESDEGAVDATTQKAKPLTKGGNYADPGYQSDKRKRYPLDTPEHVRAAASYFGRPKNRNKYSASQRRTIDSRIAAAKKKFKIGDDDTKKAGPGESVTNDTRIQQTVAGAVVPTVEPAAVAVPPAAGAPANEAPVGAVSVDDVANKVLDGLRPVITELREHVDGKVVEMQTSVNDAVSKAAAVTNGATDVLSAAVHASVTKAREATASGGAPVNQIEGGQRPLAAVETVKAGEAVKPPRWAESSEMARGLHAVISAQSQQEA